VDVSGQRTRQNGGELDEGLVLQAMVAVMTDLTLNAGATPLRELARRLDWRLVVLFGSVARGEAGRDLDLAVLPTAVPGLLEQGRWQAELEAIWEPRPVDLLVLSVATSPVTAFRVFRDGSCLFESEPGLFDRERDRAFFLYADSEVFRRQQREVLHGRGR
jgi:predicted nucleotidyltransferase